MKSSGHIFWITLVGDLLHSESLLSRMIWARRRSFSSQHSLGRFPLTALTLENYETVTYLLSQDNLIVMPHHLSARPSMARFGLSPGFVYGSPYLDLLATPSALHIMLEHTSPRPGRCVIPCWRASCFSPKRFSRCTDKIDVRRSVRRPGFERRYRRRQGFVLRPRYLTAPRSVAALLREWQISPGWTDEAELELRCGRQNTLGRIHPTPAGHWPILRDPLAADRQKYTLTSSTTLGTVRDAVR